MQPGLWFPPAERPTAASIQECPNSPSSQWTFRFLPGHVVILWVWRRRFPFLMKGLMRKQLRDRRGPAEQTMELRRVSLAREIAREVLSKLGRQG